MCARAGQLSHPSREIWRDGLSVFSVTECDRPPSTMTQSLTFFSRIVHSSLCVYDARLPGRDRMFTLNDLEDAHELARAHTCNFVHWPFTVVVHIYVKIVRDDHGPERRQRGGMKKKEKKLLLLIWWSRNLCFNGNRWADAWNEKTNVYLWYAHRDVSVSTCSVYKCTYPAIGAECAFSL